VDEIRGAGVTAPLESLLISPIQRIPRYVLLLADLLKHTLPHHPGHGALTDAVQRIRHIAEYVNEQQHAAEARQHVAVIAHRLHSSAMVRAELKLSSVPPSLLNLVG
jgi:hypothetical protein